VLHHTLKLSCVILTIRDGHSIHEVIRTCIFTCDCGFSLILVDIPTYTIYDRAIDQQYIPYQQVIRPWSIVTLSLRPLGNFHSPAGKVESTQVSRSPGALRLSVAAVQTVESNTKSTLFFNILQC
jgi:hypothetical protein